MPAQVAETRPVRVDNVYLVIAVAPRDERDRPVGGLLPSRRSTHEEKQCEAGYAWEQGGPVYCSLGTGARSREWRRKHGELSTRHELHITI